MADAKIKVTKNGPYLITGKLPLDKQIITLGKENEPETWVQGETLPDQETYALCRCGKSNSKPYCDGSHVKVNFNGDETASKEKYEKQAQTIEGPNLDLADAQPLCSSMRFCHRSGGTWNLTENSNDPKAKAIAIEGGCNCASGRLVPIDKKTGKPIEKKFEKSISLVEDPQKGVSGPIWAKGGVQVESCEGFKYEIRNRQTLCRCGESQNKPFCDGCHIDANFNDGDKSLKKGKK